MKANELRAGNWVVTKPDALFTQNYRQRVNEHAIANFSDDFLGILLDDLILSKCTRERIDFIQYGNGACWNSEYPKTVGYDYIINDQIKIQWHSFHWLDAEGDIQIDQPQYALYFGGNFIRNVEFVHKLQNLVYELTDEELVFNEKL